MKIYTKSGDRGETSLANGKRVKKSTLRIEVYGTLDELTAHMGLLRDHLEFAVSAHKGLDLTSQALLRVQEELFALSSEMALAGGDFERVTQADVLRLEKEIDEMWSQVPPLKNFVLPGGALAASQAHICRCVCRRAERVLLLLRESEELREVTVIYLNRLSDWFFAVARYIHYRVGRAEQLWRAGS